MQPCPEDSRSFFEKLQNAAGLDLRDSRGKRHDLAVILTGVTLALLSHRDGSLSSVHRHLVNHYEKLMRSLKLEVGAPISRAQLPRVLEKVSLAVFDELVFAHFGQSLNSKQKKWFAIDGKELRGSIGSGEKRGEAIVQVVSHHNLQTAAQSYYSGDKESEVPAVRSLLKKNGLASQKISLDALHCKAQTLEIIVAAGGKYLVGLKENQKELKREVSRAVKEQAFLYKSVQLEKGHGRIELREYEFYDVLAMKSEQRWHNLQIRTAIKVTRSSEELTSGKESRETSYYLTNEVGNYEELCAAIRRHWSVETNNHLRDVSLSEDKMRSKKRSYNEQWEALEVYQR